jgi:hypothetical protein
VPGPPAEAAVHLHETAALYYSLVLVLIGTQLVATGFVAEMIAALVSRDRDEFSIAQYTSPHEKTPGQLPPRQQWESAAKQSRREGDAP